MDKAASPPSGVLVVRVWLEGHSRDGFRARITESRSGNPEQAVLATISPQEVCAAVRRWIDRFIEDLADER